MAPASPSRWRVAVAYGAVMLASSAMNNLFVTYYLHYFTHVVRLHPAAFYLGQTVFAVWNAVNDPLFGWLSDAAAAGSGGGGGGRRRAWLLSRRLPALRLGGALWAAAFGAVWWPWLPWAEDGVAGRSWAADAVLGLQFAAAVCLYDGMLTYVEVNHGAMLAEATNDPQERALGNAAAGVCAAVGSITSYMGYVTYRNLPAFRFLTLTVAVVSLAVFEASARGLDVGVGERAPASGRVAGWGAAGWSTQEGGSNEDHPDAARRKGLPPSHSPAGRTSFMSFLRQLASSRNFAAFVVISALQSFDCTFGKAFFVPFMNLLAPSLDASHAAGGGVVGAGEVEWMAMGTRGTTIWLSFLLPHLLTVVWTPLIASRGLHTTLSVVFGLRGAIIVAAAVSAPTSPLSILLFMLSSRVTSESVCRLFPLVLSDLIDEDRVMHGRDAPLSASLIGTASFVSKLAQSVAPMVGMAVLSRRRSDGGGEGVDAPPSPAYLQWVWFMVLAIPAMVVTAQLAMWRWVYTLHGAHLQHVKAVVGKAAGARVDVQGDHGAEEDDTA